MRFLRLFSFLILAVGPTNLAFGTDGTTSIFGLPTISLSIFGVQYTADYLGPPEGTIVETRVMLEYSNPGPLDAADLILTLQAPSEGLPIWQFTGADLGWSGQGNFTAELSTDVLNGVIDLGEPTPNLSLFLFTMAAVDFQPLTGQFTASTYEVDVKPTTDEPADLNADGSVGAPDLALLLGAWGRCTDPNDCAADLDGDGTVGPADLALLLGSWG